MVKHAQVGVPRVDFRTLELSMLRYGKNGRSRNWPRVLSPTSNVISYLAHHRHYSDRIIANFLGPSFNDFSASQPFHIDRLTFLKIKMTLSLHQKLTQIAD